MNRKSIQSEKGTPSKKSSKNSWWGKSTSIDLYNVDRLLITNPDKIKKFIADLCTAIKMKRHGETLIDRFGSGDLEGYSALQFIETSSVTAHFDETENRAFLDVFSCKDYNPITLVEFCKKELKSNSVRTFTIDRGI